MNKSLKKILVAGASLLILSILVDAVIAMNSMVLILLLIIAFGWYYIHKRNQNINVILKHRSFINKLSKYYHLTDIICMYGGIGLIIFGFCYTAFTSSVGLCLFFIVFGVVLIISDFLLYGYIENGEKKLQRFDNQILKENINNYFKNDIYSNYTDLFIDGFHPLDQFSYQRLRIHLYYDHFAIYKFSDNSISFEPSNNHAHYFLINIDFTPRYNTNIYGGGRTPIHDIKLNKDFLDDDYSVTSKGGETQPIRTSTSEVATSAILTLLPVGSNTTFNIRFTDANRKLVVYLKEHFLVNIR